MKITFNNIGKRYNYEWIFRKVNYEFTNDYSYVVLGANGSGKSTFIRLVSGNIMPSEGSIEYVVKAMDAKDKEVNGENIFEYLSFASPYLELPEELTLKESIRFHEKFKNFFPSLTTENIMLLAELEKSRNKQLKYFSSGMKQRVKLALAILSQTPLLLLDEPASNLDKKGIAWYQQLIKQYSENRLIIICSNQQQHEYEFCSKQLMIEDYK